MLSIVLVPSRFTVGTEPGSTASTLLDAVPRNLYRSLWYVSGWNQFYWSTWAYLPLWGLLTFALAGLIVRRPPTAQLTVLVTFVLAGLIAVCLVALSPLTFTTFQGRLAFVGLPALGCLVALGLERWMRPAIRLIVPLAGFLGSVSAIHEHVLIVYR